MGLEEFKVWLSSVLDVEGGELEKNFGDEYYWEYWSIEKLDNGKLKVGFNIGSGSGFIAKDIEYKEVTYKQLWELYKAQAPLGEFDALSKLRSQYYSIPARIVDKEEE